MALKEPGASQPEAEAEIAHLYRLASNEEPPARLDKAVAQAARAPAARGGGVNAVPWWVGWRVPFALAAVALVSVSLVSLMVDEGGERLTGEPPAAPPAALERAPQAGAPPAEQAVPAPRAQGAEPIGAGRDAPPGVKAEVAKLGTAQREAPPEQRSQPSTEAPAVLPRQAPQAAAPAGAADVATAARERAEAAPGGPELRASQPAARPAEQVAPQAPAARALRGERPAAPAPRLEPEVATHVRELEERAPALWIERILVLRKEGRRAEADGVLAEFRRRFPQEPLPAALQ